MRILKRTSVKTLIAHRAAYIRQPGRGSEGIGLNHGGLYAAMAEKLLEPVVTVVSSSGWGTGKWQKRVSSDGPGHGGRWSGAEGIAAVAGPHSAGEDLAKGGNLADHRKHDRRFVYLQFRPLGRIQYWSEIYFLCFLY
jgi:hypothetical protein